MLRLVSANLNYSSWSMRAWLALEASGLEYRLHDVGLKTKDGWKQRILSFSGAGQVPILVDGQLSVHESLAICEYVAELAPDRFLWPEERQLRARGRAISCEMLSGFSVIRTAMPSNLRARAASRPSADGLQAELERVFGIWEASLESTGGPFLLGELSIADFMYMPLMGRFRTYGIELSPHAERYSAALLAHPLIQKLDANSLTEPPIAEYDAAVSRL